MNRFTLKAVTKLALLAAWSIVFTIEITQQVYAQEPQNRKCELEQLGQELKSGVIPDMIGCGLKPTTVVLRQHDHVVDISEVSGPPPQGRIVAQSPDPQTLRRPDTRIALQFSDGAASDQEVNIAVTMTLETAAPYRTGDEVKYLVVVNNPSPFSVALVRVDMEGANVTFTAVNPTFANDPLACHEIPCELRSLPANSNSSIFVVARIGDENVFSNRVTVTPQLEDVDSSDNSVSISGDVEPTPDTPQVGTGAAVTDTTMSSVDSDTKATQPTDPPTVADQGPARSANISVSAFGNLSERRRAGDYINYHINVTNYGPNSATNVAIEAFTENLTVNRVEGDCPALPCTIPSIPVLAKAHVAVTATLGSVGTFRTVVKVAAAEKDPSTIYNSASFQGKVLPGRPPTPWVWILTGSIVLIGVGAAATQSIRNWRWRRVVTATPSLDLVGSSSLGPVKMVTPPIAMRSRIDIGDAKPTSAIHVTSDEVRHG